MKAHYYTGNRQIAIEVEGDLKEVFKQLASVQEVFGAESACGCCKKTNIRFQFRSVDGNDFYEMVCNDCHARFEFGQLKKDKTTLFPKRRKGGQPLPNGGWAHFVKDEKAA